MAGKVTAFKPNEELKIDIVAEVTNGEPDFKHPDNKKWEGAYDHYTITEKDGITTLTLESASPSEFYNDFVPGWEKSWEKLKSLRKNKNKISFIA